MQAITADFSQTSITELLSKPPQPMF